MECFLVPQRDLGCFCAGAVAPKPALFWGTHPTPLKTEIPTLSTKSQTFYTINFFSDSPEGFALLLGQCTALRSLAHLTTPFLASWNAPKWGFCPKDRTYRAFFVFLHKRNFFLAWSQRDWMHLGPLCMQLRAPVSFCSPWEGPKMGLSP